MTKKSDQQAKPQFGLVKQFLRDISFESPNSNIEIDESKIGVEISIGLENKSLDKEHFEVCLHLNANAKNEEKTMFLAEIKYVGIFVAREIPEEQLEMLLGIEAPQLLFPFARAMLMNVIGESGCRVPNIEPINFGHIFLQAKNQKANAPEEQKKIEEQK